MHQAARLSAATRCDSLANEIIEKAKIAASYLLEASAGDLEFRSGHFHVVGTDRAIDLREVAKTTYHPARLPKHLRVGLEANSYFVAEPPGFPNGCHICEVEVDPSTGEVTVDRYAAVDDFGRLINPLIVRGQVHGAVAQGLGQALGEHLVYEDEGQLVTASFMDYPIPRAHDTIPIDLAFNEEPCRTNPLGVKGAGEGGCVAATPAVINAILDAIKPLGVRHIDMPVTPHRLWQAICQSSLRHKSEAPRDDR